MQWSATILACVIASAASFTTDRYFRDTSPLLVAPISWALGYLVGGYMVTFALSSVIDASVASVAVGTHNPTWTQDWIVAGAAATATLASRVIPPIRRQPG